jgi:hypothetical protein
MVYSGDWGKLIHEKNQKSKISWHCPFKECILVLLNWAETEIYFFKENCILELQKIVDRHGT